MSFEVETITYVNDQCLPKPLPSPVRRETPVRILAWNRKLPPDYVLKCVTYEMLSSYGRHDIVHGCAYLSGAHARHDVVYGSAYLSGSCGRHDIVYGAAYLSGSYGRHA
ncbi:MAG: hypothetical protein ACE5Z5_05750 [Candidatus Bathyarchaeia archaeon]